MKKPRASRREKFSHEKELSFGCKNRLATFAASSFFIALFLPFGSKRFNSSTTQIKMDMKYFRFLFFAFMGPIFGLAQTNPLTVSYDPVTNLLSADLSDCDPCRFVNPTDYNTCLCIQHCYTSITNDCSVGCAGPGSPINSTFYNICKGQCCNQFCGGPIGAIKKVVGFDVTFQATNVAIPLDPLFFPPTVSISVPFVFTDEVIIGSAFIPQPWPAAHLSGNSCYIVILRVAYNDFTFCQFANFHCFYNG